MDLGTYSDFGHGHMPLRVVSCSTSLPEGMSPLYHHREVRAKFRKGRGGSGMNAVVPRFQGFLLGCPDAIGTLDLRGSHEWGPQSTFPLRMSARWAGKGKQGLSLAECGPVGSAECCRGRRGERPPLRALLGESLPPVDL